MAISDLFTITIYYNSSLFYPCLCYSQGPNNLNQVSLHTEMGEMILPVGTPKQTTGYPLNEVSAASQ